MLSVCFDAAGRGGSAFGQHLLEFPRRRVQRAVAVVNKADRTGRDDLLQVELHQLAPLRLSLAMGSGTKARPSSLLTSVSIWSVVAASVSGLRTAP